MSDFKGVFAWLRPAYHTTYVWLCIAFVMLGSIGHGARWEHNTVFIYDMDGYYVYLPAALLSHDLGDLSWTRAARANYRPDMNPDNGNVVLPNGRIIFKYPMGMAVLYSPWFGAANGISHLQGQPVTAGYERVYQCVVSLGCMAYVLLGLWLLGRELRHFFSDSVAALVLLLLALGSNLFNYAAHEPLMSHGSLFLLNTLLLRYTRLWYAQGRASSAAALGLTAGLMVLVRPSELMMLAVPVLWGLSDRSAVKARWQFWGQKWPQLLLAAALLLLVAGLQFVFWRVVGGQWLVPFYPGERFYFDKPHVWEGLFSVRKGWLLYSPVFAFALAGIFWVRRWAAAVFPLLVVLVPIFIYITFCWHDWGYGGSYGGRAMISLYPLLSFGMAAFWQRWLTGRAAWLWLPLLLVLVVLSLVQNYQYSIALIHWDAQTWELYKANFLKLR